MKRELFTVEGNTWQKKAFVEQLEAEGFKKHPNFRSDLLFAHNDVYLCNDVEYLCTNNHKKDKHFILPQDWDIAIEAFRDYCKEEELVVGRWYKTPSGNYIKFSEVKGYEIHYSVGVFPLANEVWRERDYVDAVTKDELVPATKEGIQTALENEAKKREFKRGSMVKELIKEDSDRVVSTGNIFFAYDYNSDTLYYGGVALYHNGKWAEVLPSTPDITINGYKAEFKESTVKFGCQTFHKNGIAKLVEAASYFKAGDYKLTSFKLANVEVGISQIVEINNYFTKGE